MKQLYPSSNTFSFKRNAPVVSLFSFLILFSFSSFSQDVAIPELVFKNSQLISGTAGQNNAVYKFANVIGANVISACPGGVDALLSINGRGTNNSNYPASGVRLVNLDIASNGHDGNGYDNAWQPQITYDLSTSYTLESITNLSFEQINSGATQIGKRFVGPYTNGVGIDVTKTNLETTNHYLAMTSNSVVFRAGARSNGNTSGSNVERMNSIWFKTITYSQPVTLPVNLLSFTAQLNDQKVTLNWETSIESNLSHFAIQRSLDGKEFDDKGLVFTEGNSATARQYVFSDNIGSVVNEATTKNTLVYYRLKFVDLDGKFKFSDVQVVKLSKDQSQTGLGLFPNPAVSNLRVTIPAGWQNKTVSYSVYNSSGRLLLEKQTNNGGQIETINVAAFPVGVYMVRATTGTQSIAQGFIKAQ